MKCLFQEQLLRGVGCGGGHCCGRRGREGIVQVEVGQELRRLGRIS